MSNMVIDWELLFKGGSLAGLASFLWLAIKDVVKYCKRPKLIIIFSRDENIRVWRYRDLGIERKFITLNIENHGTETAKRCVAILKIIKKPEHTSIIENKLTLHWAGVDYSMQTTGAEPVDIGPESRRLDVAFTQLGQTIEGCMIAIPFALSGPPERNQAFFAAGEYIIEIEIKCENGKGERAVFKLISPSIWTNLDFEKI